MAFADFKQTKEKLTVDEMLTISNTNWNVVKEPLVTKEGWTTDSYGIFREDTGEYLSTVGARYTPTQNKTLLEQLYLAAEYANVSIARGGFISRGKRVFYQLGLGEDTIGGSKMRRWLTALNSHDGQTPLGFGTTNVVVVCQNTFFRALGEVDKVRHTPNSHDRLSLIVASMSQAILEENTLITQFKEMSGLYIPEKLDDDFLRDILGVEENTRSDNRLRKLKEAIASDVKIHGNTQWGLFNGVTRFTTHYDNSKDRARSIMEGSGYKINNRALELIPAM
jgi:phage/plasmid-like protein (TIGR03299 family)